MGKNKTSARKSSELCGKGNNSPRSARKSSECYRPLTEEQKEQLFIQGQSDRLIELGKQRQNRPSRPMSRQEQMSPKERHEKRIEYLNLNKELKISTTGRKHRDWLEHLEELKKIKINQSNSTNILPCFTCNEVCIFLLVIFFISRSF